MAGISLLFVAIDIRTTPESPVLKWGFVLLTAYTGVFGAFLNVLGCREPLPGLHERYVAERWRQTLGSTMHCVAGDGVGILAGAVLASILGLVGPSEVLVEYVLGFAFGWMIFPALFMRDMAGGSYSRALTNAAAAGAGDGAAVVHGPGGQFGDRLLVWGGGDQCPFRLPARWVLRFPQDP